MGFFDREVRSSFDRMFDLNRDGALDPAEQAFQMDVRLAAHVSNG